MSLIPNDLLPQQARDALPEPVGTALIDLGIACNAAASAVNQGRAWELHFQSQAAAATALGLPWYQQTTTSLELSVTTFVDTLIVEYAIAATNLTVAAINLAEDLIANREVRAPVPTRMLPSQLLSDPIILLNPIQVPQQRDVRAADNHNPRLASMHRELTTVLAQRVLTPGSNRPTSAYDDVRMAARRQTGAIDLVESFPEALHAYAAAIIDVVAELVAPAPGTVAENPEDGLGEFRPPFTSAGLERRDPREDPGH